MSPVSYLSAIQSDLTKLAKARRIDRFQAYLQTPRFRELLIQLPPDRIETCMRLVARTRNACRLPAPPKPIGQGRIKQWTPALRARLAHSYAKFGPKAHVAVAADMGLTVGQVRLAKRTYLDAEPGAQRLAA